MGPGSYIPWLVIEFVSVCVCVFPCSLLFQLACTRDVIYVCAMFYWHCTFLLVNDGTDIDFSRKFSFICSVV